MSKELHFIHFWMSFCHVCSIWCRKILIRKWSIWSWRFYGRLYTMRYRMRSGQSCVSGWIWYFPLLVPATHNSKLVLNRFRIEVLWSFSTSMLKSGLQGSYTASSIDMPTQLVISLPLKRLSNKIKSSQDNGMKHMEPESSMSLWSSS